MTTPLHVVVVGAGIVGAATAEALAIDGVTVTVIEGGIPAGGASAAGMGHIVVMDDSEPQIALTTYSQRLWDDRGPSLPASGERSVCGTIWVAADEEEMGEVDRKFRFYRDRNIEAQVLSARELYRAEPNLRPGLSGGLLVSGDSVIYPPTIVNAMLDRVREAGGTVVTGMRVVSMCGHEVELEDGRQIECDYAVNATGAAAPQLLPNLNVKPRKGHLAITDRYPGFVTHQLVASGVEHDGFIDVGRAVRLVGQASDQQTRKSPQRRPHLSTHEVELGSTQRELRHHRNVNLSRIELVQHAAKQIRG